MPSRMKRKNSDSISSPLEKHTDSLLKITQNSALVESLLGSSNTLNSSRKSEGKRKSLHCQSDSQDTFVEDESESDIRKEEEKEELWNALTTKKNDLAQSKAKEGGSKPKHNNFLLTLEQRLTPEELDAHYSQCIDLFSKNKVNTKNAFKLQLIDCMKMIMDKKSEKSENLALMSCTLDASAKIYSCRVDNVYTNVLKFVKTYQSGGKNNKIEGKEDGDESSKGDASSDEENHNSAKNKKKDKKKSSRVLKSFIKEVDSFNRKVIEMCYYRQNLPRRQTYFLESSFLGEGYKLATNRPLFTNYTPTQCSTLFPLELIWNKEVDRDNFEEKIPGYKDLRSKVIVADDGPIEEQVKENSFTFDPTVNSIAEMRPFNEACDNQSSVDGSDVGDPGDIELDYDDCEPVSMIGEDAGDCTARGGEIPCERISAPGAGIDPLSTSASSLPTPRASFTPIAMSRMLRSTHSKPSDYSYFDDSKLAFMPSASHWKIKPAKRSITAIGKTPSKSRQNKKKYLEFTSMDHLKLDIEALLEDNKQTHMLSHRTNKDWFYNKDNLVFKPIIPGARKTLLSFHKDPDTCLFNVIRNSESSNEEFGVNDSVLLNPQGFDNPNNDSIDDDRGDDLPGNYHPLEDWSENMDNVDSDPEVNKEEENPDKTNISEVPIGIVDGEDSLVPAPMRVEKVSVKFAKAQKRIDIKKLKQAIWNILDLDSKNTENKENEKGRRSRDFKKKEVNYSDIYAQIPDSISKEAAAELSYPIAFMAILHMANEKNLRLTSNHDHSDFSVSLE